MGYKLKRILIYPDGVTEKQVYPALSIPLNGLLGYRKLQSDLKDASGNGNNGSWYSGTGSFGTVGGKTGAIVTRNSSNDLTTQHIVTTLNYSGPTVTVCGWIYYNNLQTAASLWHGIMTNSNTYASYISLSDRPTQSNKWSVGGSGNTLTVNSAPSTGTRYFVVGVLTNSGKKIYVNGSLAGSDSTGFTSGQGTIWRLGCGQLGNSDSASFGGTDGYVRHCAIYNRALTAAEVLEFYNNTK